MSKKKDNEEVTEVTCEINKEPTPYELLEWRVKDFIEATVNLVDIQESIIRAERRCSNAKKLFDVNLKQLEETMGSYEEKDV